MAPAASYLKLGIGHYAAQSLLRVSPGCPSMYTRSAERSDASLKGTAEPCHDPRAVRLLKEQMPD